MESKITHLALPLVLLVALGLGFASWRFGTSGAVDATDTAGSGTATPLAERAGTGGGSTLAQSSAGALAARDSAQHTGPARPRAIDPALSAEVEAAIVEAQERVDDARIKGVRGRDCEIGVYVIDAESGAVVVERRADRAFAPASNMKLITTLAALLALPADWAFETRIEADGDLDGARLGGDLVVRAGGDPFFVREDPHGASARIGRLAAAVANAGIERVEGDLLLDLGDFKEARPATGWPEPKSQWWTESYGLAAPFTVQAGLITASVRCAERDGDYAGVSVWPRPSGLTEEHTVRTVANSINDVRIGLNDAGLRLRVTGKLGPPGRAFDKTFRHPAPIKLFESVLRAELDARGVRLDGAARTVRNHGPGRPLGSVRSPWIELLTPINTDSANSVADALLIALGHDRYGDGSRSGGMAAVRDVLGELGLEHALFRQADGSGLSRDNRATPDQLGELLAAALTLPSDQRLAFLSSLPLMGETGTLDDRMRDSPARGRVRAKTGWINGASALSGYATSLGEREFVFSILVSYPLAPGLNTRAFKPCQERIVEALVVHDAKELGTVR